MENILKDWKFEPDVIKFEPGRIEISPEIQELMDQGLDVRHYLSRHLQGDCGYIDNGEHAYYAGVGDVIEFSKAIGLQEYPQSEYIIAPDKVLGILTYTMPPDGPSTILEVGNIDPQNLAELSVEELYITAMTLLNQLPPDERQKLVTSATQKIPQVG